jgi:hypothetical protein
VAADAEVVVVYMPPIIAFKVARAEELSIFSDSMTLPVAVS